MHRRRAVLAGCWLDDLGVEMSELTIEKIRAAMEEVDDDLPDGAYWAMVHEILGVEYGEIFPLLAEDQGVESENDANA